MEPANFPEIYTGNGDESDRMQDIAGCFDPIIPRNDGFQYDIEAAASDVYDAGSCDGNGSRTGVSDAGIGG